MLYIQPYLATDIAKHVETLCSAPTTPRTSSPLDMPIAITCGRLHILHSAVRIPSSHIPPKPIHVTGVTAHASTQRNATMQYAPAIRCKKQPASAGSFCASFH